MKSLKKCLGPVLLLTVILVLAGCGGGGEGSNTNLGSITGVVSGSIANTLIYKATVTAMGGGKTYTTATAFDGSYTLHVPAGTYQLTVGMDTYNDANANDITVAAGATQTQNFALVTGAGNTLDWPPELDGTSEAYTLPGEIDVRSPAWKIDGEGRPRLDMAKASLPAIKSAPAGYSCFIRTWVEIPATANTGIKGFRVYRSISEAGPFTLIASVSFWTSGNEPNKYYDDFDPTLTPGEPSKYYRISFWGDNGESSISNAIQRTPLPPLTLTSPGQAAVDVALAPVFQWNGLPNISWYGVDLFVKDTTHWARIGSSSWNIPGTTTETTYGDSYWDYDVPGPLSAGSEYLWCVGAWKPGAVSWSYSRTFITIAE